MNTDSSRAAKLMLIKTRERFENSPFFYGVKTTGVFCKPGCPSRTPAEGNVVFFDSVAEAREAGYRPCKRCEPEKEISSEVAKVTEICRLIEGAESPPNLSEIAEEVHLSPWHLQRTFKRVTGLTPKEYASFVRTERLKTQLNSSVSVTDAMFSAGFGSASRLYEQSEKILAMKPSVYRRGGVGMEIHFGTAECRFGYVLVASTESGICALTLDNSEETLAAALSEQFPKAVIKKAGIEIEDLIEKVVKFVDEPGIGIELPLDIQGTVFQRKVWQALLDIPRGETRSYKDIAMAIGKPKAVRAVANACAHNNLAIAIPCHRVVRSDGGLGGYRWGIDRKAQLLASEKDT